MILRGPKIFFWLFFTVCLVGCSSVPHRDLYESATPVQMASFKRVRLPFLANTKFKVSQGAFGLESHMEPGNEYSWDFDVPVGTPVVSVENGIVLEVWEPNSGGDCEPVFTNLAHNIKVEHEDGTVAQYVHTSAKVKMGELVREGQVIGVTAINGWICKPQLHFSVYRSKENLYQSPDRETVPLSFDGLPQLGKASKGITGRVPQGLQVNLVKDTPETQKTLQLLNEILKKYDLSPYFFTMKIQIEPFVIPHDYPILTLNTRHNGEPDVLLSTFLHEQSHRFLSGPNDEKANLAIQDLRQKYTSVPVGGDDGADNEDSTYLHLLVCWFELQADKKYLGEKRAYNIMKKMDHYKWIYRQILSNEKELGEIVLKNRLHFVSANGNSLKLRTRQSDSQ